MSHTQSWAVKNEAQLRPGRSGSSGQHRGRARGGGGGGVGGFAPPRPPPQVSSSSSSTIPPLSANQSFKKSGNGQEGPSPRVNVAIASSEAGVAVAAAPLPPMQNRPHVPPPFHGSSDKTKGSAAKPVDASAHRNFRTVPSVPSSQSAAGASDSATPVTPVKGDGSMACTFQFGTLSPGIMNRLQVPARTSSASPNPDEQKRDQAGHDMFRFVPTLPTPSAPKQQHQQQDFGGINQSHTGGSRPPAYAKRDTCAQTPAAPTAPPPKPHALPIATMSTPMFFQHPQVPMQFGGPRPQVQSQGVTPSSMQIPMSLASGNAPQVPQQMFVHGLQSHPLQPQPMMHQGQGLGFAPQVGHQLAPQFGNLGGGIVAPQYAQQHPGNFAGPPKTTVKITHPDTHEELRLGQAQRISTFISSSYYQPLQPNLYNPSPIFLPTSTSLPLISTQITQNAESPSYGYTVVQSGRTILIRNPSVLNPNSGSKSAPPSHCLSEPVNLGANSVSSPPAPLQGAVKPAVASLGDRVGAPSARITTPMSKAEAPRLLKTPVEVTASDQKGDNEINTQNSSQQPISVSEPSDIVSIPSIDAHSTAVTSVLSSQRKQTGTSVPFTTVGDSGSVVAGADRRRVEPVQRSDTLQDHQKMLSEKDLRHLHQEHQMDASDSAGGAKLSSLNISGDCTPQDLATKLSKKFEDIQGASGEEISNATIILPSLGVEQSISMDFGSEVAVGEAIPSTSGSSELVSKEAPDIPVLCLNTSESAYDCGISIKEKDLSETTSGKMNGTVSKILDSAYCQLDHTSLEVEQKRNIMAAIEHGKTKVSNDSSRDSNVKVHPISTITESFDGAGPIVLGKHEETGADNSGESNCESHAAVSHKNATGLSLEVEMTSGKLDRPATSSVDFVEVEALPSSNPLPNDYECTTSTNSPNKSDPMCSQDIGSSDPAGVPAPVASERTHKLERQVSELSGGVPVPVPVPVMLSGPKGKPSLEPTRAKTTTGKKKKRRNILSKADAAGTSDIYNAYKGLEENHEIADISESMDSSLSANVTNVIAVEPDKDVVATVEVGQVKCELDDWGNAANVSCQKVRALESGQQVNGGKKHHDDNGYEATSSREYTRDFLLTFQEHFTDLPIGFEISSDIARVLMRALFGNSHFVEREPYPSPGRITNRSPGVPRVGAVDDNKWIKAPGPVVHGRDFRPDVGHRPAVVSIRTGVDHGIVRHPHGSVHSLPPLGGIPRNSADADRWSHSSGISRGIIPSQAPLQVMHRAEKKYKVGKVSDKEEAKQRQLKAILNKLTPQNFEKLFEQVKEVDIDNTVTLTGVISQIFDKALMEPTFCEMYATFCFHLAAELPDFSENNEKITFKRLLLNKCQEEFERGEREQAEANRTEDEGGIKQSEEEREMKKIKARRRMLGNIRLIGELYKMRMLTERIMHECIQKLLGQHQNPDEEDIEALCKLMSTIGEMIDHLKAKEHMDAYFDTMQKLSTNQKLSSRVRFMLKDAIDLRKNKWHQRRKVEGPKKIEEVHRDAAQERKAQTSRLARGNGINHATRRGSAVGNGIRGSSVLPSPSSQVGGIRGLSPAVRGYGTHDVRLEDRHLLESRTFPVRLHQRPIGDDSITLGPQGCLARGMSIRGQSRMPNVPLTEITANVRVPRRLESGQNGYSSSPNLRPYNSREVMPRYMPDSFFGASKDHPNSQDRDTYSGSRDPRNTECPFDRSLTTTTLPTGRIQGTLGVSSSASPEATPLSEECLREKSISAIKEYYSAKDDEEVALCIKELNSPSFYPSMISLWVMDSFERKDKERDLLATLLVNLCKSGENLLSQVQLIQGFESVLCSLEDAVNDAPKASEFLGRMFGKVILEDVVPLREIGRLVHEGGEERGRLLEIGLASEVIGSTLEIIRVDKGDSVLNEIRTISNLRLEDFRPPHPTAKSKKLDVFL